MIRLIVRPKHPQWDSRGRLAAEKLGLSPDSVQSEKLFYVPLPAGEALAIGQAWFRDPIVEEVLVEDGHQAGDRPQIEIALRPGVTDNEGQTASEILSAVLGRPIQVHAARRYIFSDSGVDLETLRRRSEKQLGNPLIEQFRVNAPAMPAFDVGLQQGRPKVESVVLPEESASLAQLSRHRLLALSADEMAAIRQYFLKQRDARSQLGLSESPTDVELELLAQTWSEHCKHKIFNDRIDYVGPDGHQVIDGIFKTFIQQPTQDLQSDWLVSVFRDNAGVVRFDEHFHAVFKVETHNSPSALEPYGGALTGIVGVNRDPAGTGRGARLIANTDVFCVGSPFREGELPDGIWHPRSLLAGIHRGVRDGGNQSGVPTVNGAIFFDETFTWRPLVFCGTVGLMQVETDGEPTHVKQIHPGDLIVMAGGRVGADGIHGATFSSQGLEEQSPLGVVQIGDPITQKRLLDFLEECRPLYRTLTDNGAGGLGSSVGELAELSGGADLDLATVPLKYPGLQPWQILVSESQERMTLAVPPENWNDLVALAKRRHVEISAIGTFTGTGTFQIRHGQTVVGQIDLAFLHGGRPVRTLPASWQAPAIKTDAATIADPNVELLRLMASLNICSREPYIRQYDHEVQAATVIKPLVGVEQDGPSDAAVLRPVPTHWRGLVISNGLCPQLTAIDPYIMAQNAVDEAIRNAVAVGGDPDQLALLDNFCWPDPVDDPFKMGQLVRASQGLKDAVLGFGTPLISGKDSMKNDYKNGSEKRSILPTLLVSAIGIVPDVRHSLTLDLKAPGDLVYLVGGTQSLEVDVPSAHKRYQTLHHAIQQGWVNAAHDCSEGGLAVALAEMAIAGRLGIQAEVPDFFTESPSRLVVTVRPDDQTAFEALFDGQSLQRLGHVTTDKTLTLTSPLPPVGGGVIHLPIDALQQAWQETLS